MFPFFIDTDYHSDSSLAPADKVVPHTITSMASTSGCRTFVRHKHTPTNNIDISDDHDDCNKVSTSQHVNESAQASNFEPTDRDITARSMTPFRF